jgi:alanine dehydrogenase
MLLVDNATVQKVLSMDECINVQEQAFLGLPTGASIHRPRIDMYVPCDRDDGYWRWGTMEGASKDLGVFAIRMKSDIVTWPRHEDGTWTEEKYCMEPGTYCGLIFLLSTRNGEPLAIINDGHLQHMRVGGGAGLGAKYLAREDAHIVGMIGSGGMARTYLEAFMCVRDIHKVRVYSPTKANREAYAKEMSATLDIEVEPVPNAEDAVRGADIVSCCTDSNLPVIEPEWLEPGMHVTNLGGAELPRGVFDRAHIIVRQGQSGLPVPDGDDRIQAGRGHSPAAYIAGSEEEMKRLPPAAGTEVFQGVGYPSFVELAKRQVTRTGRDQVTVYLNVGNQGLQFAAVGSLVYKKCREQGLGRSLPTEWFLQDIRD